MPVAHKSVKVFNGLNFFEVAGGRIKHHSVDLPWWESLVKTTDGRKLITKGYATVPLTAPGLGIELNEEVVKQHLHQRDKTYFAPTKEWDERRSHDRIFS